LPSSKAAEAYLWVISSIRPFAWHLSFVIVKSDLNINVKESYQSTNELNC